VPYLIPRTRSVQLDANGNGTVSFEIDNTNQRWVIDALGCSTSQTLDTTPIPRFDVYVNGTDNIHWRGGTYNGQRDLASGRIVLYPGDILYCTWTGGIPGTEATALLDGTFDPAGVPIQDN
jgi:hypothetical protein